LEEIKFLADNPRTRPRMTGALSSKSSEMQGPRLRQNKYVLILLALLKSVTDVWQKRLEDRDKTIADLQAEYVVELQAAKTALENANNTIPDLQTENETYAAKQQSSETSLTNISAELSNVKKRTRFFTTVYEERVKAMREWWLNRSEMTQLEL
jgi:vacuolar-type H+-ATPase subunit I/STV1